jgi:hypothetical protein
MYHQIPSARENGQAGIGSHALLAAAFNLVASNTKHLLVAEITAIFGDLGNFYLASTDRDHF